jgi:acyl-CoA synthetase (AMP-forming)/AMP-acid ligase II
MNMPPGYDREKSGTGAPSLDEIFIRSVGRKPDEIAFVDPADKPRVTGQAPRRLTYAEADSAVTTLATHFIESGLPVSSIVAVQLPNTVELMITALAAWRAGLVVALLPLLWRQAELTDALNRIGARALITSGRIDGVNHAEIGMQAAAEVFSIRHVAAFGDQLPEGPVPLDDVLAEYREPPLFPAPDPRRAALITFDVTSEGMRAVPRSGAQAIAGGLAIVLEGGIKQGAQIVSTVLPASFVALCSSLVASLVSSGTLHLHHPFDLDVLLAQISDEHCDTLIAPAQLALRLAQEGALPEAGPLRKVIGLWRSPEQAGTSVTWQGRAAFSDLYAFGEVGFFAVARDKDGNPEPIFPGPLAIRGSRATAMACEPLISRTGTLGLKGPMVPLAAYAPPQRREESLAALASNYKPLDYVDTGYAARLDRKLEAICITSPPSGIVAVGGYRFLARDLNEWAQRLAPGTMLTALPDRMSGHRLAGRASDNARARAALTELGLNPLMTEAFRDRGGSS